jgi:hypothetical protein
VTAVEVDLHIEQGADWPGIAFPILDDTNEPVDLSGCSALGQIRKTARDPEVLFAWSTAPVFGGGVVVFTGNLVAISVLGTSSTLWTFTAARYDLELHNPNAPLGQRDIRVASGAVYLSPEVTRL